MNPKDEVTQRLDIEDDSNPSMVAMRECMKELARLAVENDKRTLTLLWDETGLAISGNIPENLIPTFLLLIAKTLVGEEGDEPFSRKELISLERPESN